MYFSPNVIDLKPKLFIMNRLISTHLKDAWALIYCWLYQNSLFFQ